MVYASYFTFSIIGLFVIKRNNKREEYLLVMMFFLLLIIGLRDISVGADTLSYVEDFNFTSKLSLLEMINKALVTSEPLYIIITWLSSLLSTNYTAYLFTWALFPVYSLYIVYKEGLSNIKDYLIAIIVFFLLGLFAFYVAGIRQTAAISIVMPACIRMNKRFFQSTNFYRRIKVIIRFLLYIGIAYIIHNSAIIALIAIPCMFIKIRWWYFPIIVAFFFIGSYANLGNINMVSELLFEDRFATYGTVYESSQNISAFLMQLILFAMCLPVKETLIKRDRQNSFFLTMILIGLLFQSLSSVIAEMFRVSFYFSIFGMLLVPKAIQEYPKEIRSVVYSTFVIASLFYLFFLTDSNLPEYNSIF